MNKKQQSKREFKTEAEAIEFVTSEITRAHDKVRTEFEEAKANFLEKAASSPTYAITWAENLIELEEQVVRLNRLAGRISDTASFAGGLSLGSLTEAVREWKQKDLVEPLLNNRFRPNSTSQMHNAAEAARAEGVTQVLRYEALWIEEIISIARSSLG